MKIYEETPLSNFKFWSGAKQTVKHLKPEELDVIESYLIASTEDTAINATELNDLFWFEADFIAELLGFENFDEVMNRKDEEL